MVFGDMARNAIGLATSFSGSGSGKMEAVIQDVSVGDSGIIMGNIRFEKNQDRLVAEKCGCMRRKIWE